MPINTSHGQLPPVRRGGYRLYFFSLAKEQSLPVGRPTFRRQGTLPAWWHLATWYLLLDTWSSTNVECPTLSEECRRGKLVPRVKRLPSLGTLPAWRQTGTWYFVQSCFSLLACLTQAGLFFLSLAKPACRQTGSKAAKEKCSYLASCI